ncbi:ubiquitin-like protein Pup [Neomicrococcus aestuarii]|uniref:Prokaryotic ubiquitin-like protein Pup n=1 Tax=Neomicrococcus aestuarii TaxID=556325 RepID=A0A1L2ZLR9_9MICC|nr:ubiquitin-like protein Pup [Neomicrococcus aestuarii]APF40137.1 ubiquitin-like protein Pup [Neomicrococcus aestuarii]MBB5511885.1 ubiquitin-like protein Pup [Neomicrococcus aestuarii]
MSQEQIKPQPQKQDEEAVPGVPTPAPASASAQAQVQEVDDLLAEIDGVLETNAEEFVRGFVQKGGQ